MVKSTFRLHKKGTKYYFTVIYIGYSLISNLLQSTSDNKKIFNYLEEFSVYFRAVKIKKQGYLNSAVTHNQLIVHNE